VVTGRRVELILSIEVDAGSPRGELSAEGQPPRAFSGWLQLGEAIEAALATARGLPPGQGNRSADSTGIGTSPGTESPDPA
jgi:hypothetical protein